MRAVKSIANDLRYGHWDFGCEFYEGKPMFSAGRLYYDYWWYFLHIGPFWVTVDPI